MAVVHVEKLHKAGIAYMNMIGHSKQVRKCLYAGLNIICAQGEEGGGHTAACDVPTSILIPTIVKTAGFEDTGRPLRVRKNPGIQAWEENRKDEIKKLMSKGVNPVEHDIEELDKQDKLDDETMDNVRPWLMGKVAAVCNEKKPAKAIIDEMVAEAVEMLNTTGTLLGGEKARL
ncbi:hypothetical protein RUND412_005048 [Rhizina undulata]